MEHSFVSILQGDESLLKLLDIAGRPKSDQATIEHIDYETECAKIMELYDQMNGMVSNRAIWTVIGKLTLGITKAYGKQLNRALDESTVVEIGIRDMTQNTKTKSKIKVVAVDENANFWEVAQTATVDETPTSATDACLANAEQITLNESKLVNRASTAEWLFDNGFGDERSQLPEDFGQPVDGHMLDDVPLDHGQNVSNLAASDTGFDQFDFAAEDPEHASIVPPPNAVSIPKAALNITFDVAADESVDAPPNAVSIPEAEPNMTFDVAADDSVDASIMPPPELIPPADPVDILINASPLAPPDADTTRKRKVARQKSIFKDDAGTIIPPDVMKEQLKQVRIHCQPYKSTRIIIKKDIPIENLLKRPLINRQPSDIFLRATELLKNKQSETDYNIMHDAFDSGFQDVSREVDILQQESLNQSPARSSSRLSALNESFNRSMPLLASTPIRGVSNNVGSFFEPRSQVSIPNIPVGIGSQRSIHSTGEIGSCQPDRVISPPSNFQDDDDLIAPPMQFENSPTDVPDMTVTSTVRDQDLVEKPLDYTVLDGLLGTGSLEYVIMKKLMQLWRRKVHPIKVDNLLRPNSNRIAAAQTFASILSLRKKELVLLENDEHGKIRHIRKGEALHLNF